MSRAFLVLANDAFREKAIRWIRGAPKDTRVTFQGPKRTLPQNSRFWAMLTDISTQKEHFGRRYPPETWKAIMMNGLGREVKFIPTLDGSSVFPLAYSSSELSIGEMAELIEFMLAWGAQNGVIFYEKETQTAPSE